MDGGRDDAVIEQQHPDHQRLLRQREKPHACAEAIQDEGHHHQTHRLLAEQAAEYEVGQHAQRERRAQADVLVL